MNTNNETIYQSKMTTDQLDKKIGIRRLKIGLPQFQRGNITSFVESTVLADFSVAKNNNFDQVSNYYAARNLISACICYLYDFRPESLAWDMVYQMLAKSLDENHQVSQDNPLDVLFRELPEEYGQCYCKILYESALAGDSKHISATYGKALRALSDFIFC